MQPCGCRFAAQEGLGTDPRQYASRRAAIGAVSTREWQWFPAVFPPQRCAAPMRCVVLLVAVTRAYDFNDPDAPHTSMAIRFDGEGRRADCRRAFEPQPEFTPDLHPRQPGRVLHAHGERFCS